MKARRYVHSTLFHSNLDGSVPGQGCNHTMSWRNLSSATLLPPATASEQHGPLSVIISQNALVKPRDPNRDSPPNNRTEPRYSYEGLGGRAGEL